MVEIPLSQEEQEPLGSRVGCTGLHGPTPAVLGRYSSREGSCEKIQNRLLPALSVRRSARSTQVKRALRARFHLWIRRRDGSGLAQFNVFTASGSEGCGVVDSKSEHFVQIFLLKED